MSILWQLIVGLIIGVIARLVLPGREAISGGAMGWLITALIGMAGAFLGTMIGQFLFGRGSEYTAGWIMSILGAVILLLLYRMIARRTTA